MRTHEKMRTTRDACAAETCIIAFLDEQRTSVIFSSNNNTGGLFHSYQLECIAACVKKTATMIYATRATATEYVGFSKC